MGKEPSVDSGHPSSSPMAQSPTVSLQEADSWADMAAAQADGALDAAAENVQQAGSLRVGLGAQDLGTTCFRAVGESQAPG